MHIIRFDNIPQKSESYVGFQPHHGHPTFTHKTFQKYPTICTRAISTSATDASDISNSAITASALEFHHGGKQGRLHGHQEAQGGRAFPPLLFLECATYYVSQNGWFFRFPVVSFRQPMPGAPFVLQFFTLNCLHDKMENFHLSWSNLHVICLCLS